MKCIPLPFIPHPPQPPFSLTTTVFKDSFDSILSFFRQLFYENFLRLATFVWAYGKNGGKILILNKIYIVVFIIVNF